MLIRRPLVFALLLGSLVACDSKAKEETPKDAKTDEAKANKDEPKAGAKAGGETKTKADGGAAIEPEAKAEAPAKADPPAGGPKVLLSLEDAQDILGLTLEMDTRGEGYSYTSKSPTGNITVDLVPAMPIRMLMGNKESIPDIGDAAFFQAKSSRMAILQVIKGDKGLTISVGFPLGAPPKAPDLAEAALEVARRALPNV
ncbi:MAG: hypothetical protein AAF799_19075 [Myxococcota bacterium]